MKRVLIILLAVLSTVACKKVTPEMRIAQMADYMAEKENVHSAKLSQYEGDKRVDYLTLQLIKNLAADDLWSLENAGENSLVAEFLGKSKSDSQLTLLSASLDDPDACATILSILEAFRDLKISHKNDIQVLFYSSAQDSTGQSSLDAINQELDESGDFFAFVINLFNFFTKSAGSLISAPPKSKAWSSKTVAMSPMSVSSSVFFTFCKIAWSALTSKIGLTMLGPPCPIAFIMRSI